jgi:hypothetical protein
MPLSSLVSLGIISFILPVNTRSNDLIAKLPTPY